MRPCGVYAAFFPGFPCAGYTPVPSRRPHLRLDLQCRLVLHVLPAPPGVRGPSRLPVRQHRRRPADTYSPILHVFFSLLLHLFQNPDTIAQYTIIIPNRDRCRTADHPFSPIQGFSYTSIFFLFLLTPPRFPRSRHRLRFFSSRAFFCRIIMV